MSINQMRGYLKSLYNGSYKWVNKVNAMHDEQVVAVYYRFINAGK